MAHMGDNRNCVFYRNKENTKKCDIKKKQISITCEQQYI